MAHVELIIQWFLSTEVKASYPSEFCPKIPEIITQNTQIKKRGDMNFLYSFQILILSDPCC